jgi:hypothetical protein
MLETVYRYNPIFIIPVLKHGAPSQGSEVLVRGFESKGVLGMIFRAGHPPSHSPATKIKSLAQYLQESKRLRRPLIIFPEVCHYLHSAICGNHCPTEVRFFFFKSVTYVYLAFQGTTSNNRALLRCPKLNETSVGKYDGKVKVFCLAIKSVKIFPFDLISCNLLKETPA